MTEKTRLSTGLPALDEKLGGGLLPGKLTVILGATGIGKTQLGLQFLHAGGQQEGQPGILFDLTSRGDAQNHAEYARRMFDWQLRRRSADLAPDLDKLWEADQQRDDALHLFERAGRRVTISDLDDDAWKEWKAELIKKIDRAIAFFYANFVHGVRRCIIDGIEPTDRASDSFQFEMFEYIYHQILRKEHDWVARDLFRAHFRKNQEQIEQHGYEHEQIGCAILCTAKEIMLEELMTRPIESGDILSNANTILLMGKTKEGLKMGRALYIAKHRGSAHSEEVIPYVIEERGVKLL